jgi:tryptophan-rich sensory protein
VNPTLLAVIICVAAAALEGALAGGGVRQRFAQLRMPPYSPPFTVWLVIGGAYYAICLVVLRHLLASAFTPSVVGALALLTLVLLGNALWSVLFSLARSSCQLPRIRPLCASHRCIGCSTCLHLSCRGRVISMLLCLPCVYDVVGISTVATQHSKDLTRRCS